MSEVVTLFGGPLDGQRVALRGGDYYYAVAFDPPPTPITAAPPEAVPDAPLEHLVYRRSQNTRTIFVFQP